MHKSEEPVVRPSLLIADIETAAAALAKAGFEITHPPAEIADRGKFAIYTQGGNHHGLWQVQVLTSRATLGVSSGAGSAFTNRNRSPHLT